MRVKKLLGLALPGFTIIIGLVGFMIRQPTLRSSSASTVSIDAERLRLHVIALSQTFHPRDWTHPENLDRCAEYIYEHFTQAGATVERQVFDVLGNTYCNVIARFGSGDGPLFVVGAHYDAYEYSPGADDNASGVAVLIELAYLIGRKIPEACIELVAYSLEEPPFFGTRHMGSAYHARRLAQEQTTTKGVIVLEMVGYFQDKRGSQSFPAPILRLFYPGRGNFIMVAGRWDQGRWIKMVKTAMKGTTDLPVYSIRAPTVLPGVDFSDHRNYWPYDIPALMITDTAFYRNQNYHTLRDTADTLDYNRMSQVLVAVFATLCDMSQGG